MNTVHYLLKVSSNVAYTPVIKHLIKVATNMAPLINQNQSDTIVDKPPMSQGQAQQKQPQVPQFFHGDKQWPAFGTEVPESISRPIGDIIDKEYSETSDSENLPYVSGWIYGTRPGMIHPYYTLSKEDYDALSRGRLPGRYTSTFPVYGSAPGIGKGYVDPYLRLSDGTFMPSRHLEFIDNIAVEDEFPYDDFNAIIHDCLRDPSLLDKYEAEFPWLAKNNKFQEVKAEVERFSGMNFQQREGYYNDIYRKQVEELRKRHEESHGKLVNEWGEDYHAYYREQSRKLRQKYDEELDSAIRNLQVVNPDKPLDSETYKALERQYEDAYQQELAKWDAEYKKAHPKPVEKPFIPFEGPTTPLGLGHKEAFPTWSQSVVDDQRSRGAFNSSTMPPEQSNKFYAKYPAEVSTDGQVYPVRTRLEDLYEFNYDVPGAVPNDYGMEYSWISPESLPRDKYGRIQWTPDYSRPKFDNNTGSVEWDVDDILPNPVPGIPEDSDDYLDEPAGFGTWNEPTQTYRYPNNLDVKHFLGGLADQTKNWWSNAQQGNFTEFTLPELDTNGEFQGPYWQQK